MSCEISTTKTIVWRVPNIKEDLFDGDKKDTEMFSEIFTIFADEHYTEWRLGLEATNEDLELFLYLMDYSSKDFRVCFQANLSSSNKEQSAISKWFKKSGRDLARLKDWGWGSFATSDEFLEKFDSFVNDGILTLCCNLTVNLLPEEETKEHSNQSLLPSYEDSFQSGIFSDFKLESNDGKIFKVHKVFLDANSEVFRQMLVKKIPKGVFKITDFDSKVVEAMLKFIYTRQISDEIAYELIYAAEKYHMKELKVSCFENIVRNMTIANVFEAIKICGDISESDPVFKKCVAVVLNNWDDLLDGDEWDEMPKAAKIKLYESNVDAMRTTILV